MVSVALRPRILSQTLYVAVYGSQASAERPLIVFLFQGSGGCILQNAQGG